VDGGGAKAEDAARAGVDQTTRETGIRTTTLEMMTEKIDAKARRMIVNMRPGRDLRERILGLSNGVSKKRKMIRKSRRKAPPRSPLVPF